MHVVSEKETHFSICQMLKNDVADVTLSAFHIMKHLPPKLLEYVDNNSEMVEFSRTVI